MPNPGIWESPHPTDELRAQGEQYDLALPSPTSTGDMVIVFGVLGVVALVMNWRQAIAWVAQLF